MAIDYAYATVEEAEYSVLDAISARMEADDLAIENLGRRVLSWRRPPLRLRALGSSCSLWAASSAPAKHRGHHHGDARSEGVDRGLALVGVEVLRERIEVVLGCRKL